MFQKGKKNNNIKKAMMKNKSSKMLKICNTINGEECKSVNNKKTYKINTNLSPLSFKSEKGQFDNNDNNKSKISSIISDIKSKTI